MHSNFDSLSVEKKLELIIKLKNSELKDNKLKEKVLEQRRNEASKLYVLGLKLFIKHKLKFVNMTTEMVDKLRDMLMAHHTNRWQKIMIGGAALKSCSERR